MRFQKTDQIGAGFWAQAEPSDRLPMVEAGEIWAPRNWSIHNHHHASWEVYLQTKGHSRWTFDGKPAEVPENGAYLVRGGVEHRLVAFTKETTHFVFLVFTDENLDNPLRRATCWQQPFHILPAAHPLKLPLEGLIQELAMPDAWQRETVTAYIRAACATLSRLSEKPVTRTALDRHPSVERAMQLIKSRLDHPWRLDELARLSGISRQHLIELFRSECGRSPMQYLLQLRLDEARRQLKHTGKSVTAIAYDLGFSSSQHLSSAYRKNFGHTPSTGRG